MGTRCFVCDAGREVYYDLGKGWIWLSSQVDWGQISRNWPDLFAARLVELTAEDGPDGFTPEEAADLAGTLCRLFAGHELHIEDDASTDNHFVPYGRLPLKSQLQDTGLGGKKLYRCIGEWTWPERPGRPVVVTLGDDEEDEEDEDGPQEEAATPRVVQGGPAVLTGVDAAGNPVRFVLADMQEDALYDTILVGRSAEWFQAHAEEVRARMLRASRSCWAFYMDGGWAVWVAGSGSLQCVGWFAGGRARRRALRCAAEWRRRRKAFVAAPRRARAAWRRRLAEGLGSGGSR